MALQYENCTKGSQTAEAQFTSALAKLENELRKKHEARSNKKRRHKGDRHSE